MINAHEPGLCEHVKFRLLDLIKRKKKEEKKNERKLNLRTSDSNNLNL